MTLESIYFFFFFFETDSAGCGIGRLEKRQKEKIRSWMETWRWRVYTGEGKKEERMEWLESMLLTTILCPSIIVDFIH